jgi:hypothetical protein
MTYADDVQDAMKKLEPHIIRESDGTFRLTITMDEVDVDPIIFGYLHDSLKYTNDLIRSGVLSPNDVED